MILTDTQRTFLKKILVLNMTNDTWVTANTWLIHNVLKSDGYSKNEAAILNDIATTYKNWKQTQK